MGLGEFIEGLHKSSSQMRIIYTPKHERGNVHCKKIGVNLHQIGGSWTAVDLRVTFHLPYNRATTKLAFHSIETSKDKLSIK